MPFPPEATLEMERGLTPSEVDRRLVAAARVHRRVESVLCFYLQEVENRRLYLQYGFASTVDYGRERLGFEERKTRSLVNMAERFEDLPRLEEASPRGHSLDESEGSRESRDAQDGGPMARALQEHEQPAARAGGQTRAAAHREKTLVFVLEGDRVEAWEQAREALERLAGKTLSDIEAFDLMCAEALCTYATTPAFGDGEETDGGYLRQVADRDGWKCSRPGCSNRSALTANHIIPRARGGPNEAWNLHVVCAECHAAITEGRLKVKGRAPKGLTWEGPLGVIEKPLPLPSSKRRSTSKPSPGFPTPPRAGAGMISREGRVPYGVPARPNFGSRDPALAGGSTNPRGGSGNEWAEPTGSP
ncbi:MAG: HNH endonuclease signature motif containing protein [Vicinamibacteria bacterium]